MGKAALVQIVIGLMLGVLLTGCAGNSPSQGPQAHSSTSVRSEISGASSVAGPVSEKSNGSFGITAVNEVAEPAATRIGSGAVKVSPQSDIDGWVVESQTSRPDSSSTREAATVSEETGETDSGGTRRLDKRPGEEEVLSYEQEGKGKSGNGSGAEPLTSGSRGLNEKREKKEGRSQQGRTGDGSVIDQPAGLNSRRRPSAGDHSLEQDNSLYPSLPDVSQALAEGTEKADSRDTQRAQKRAGEEAETPSKPVVNSNSDDASHVEPETPALSGSNEDSDKMNDAKGDSSSKGEVGVRAVTNQSAGSDEGQGTPAEDRYLKNTTVAPAAQGEESSRLSGSKNGVPSRGAPRPAEVQTGGKEERRAADKWNLDWRRPKDGED